MLGLFCAALCFSAGGAGADDVIRIKIAYGNQVGEPNDKAVREWGRLMRERSGGQVEFEYFPASQMGSQVDVTEQLLIGSNVITISDGGSLMEYVPAFGVTFLPYLFDRKEQLFRLVDSDLFKDLSKQLEAKGLYIVHSKWIYGTRQMLVSRRVTRPADLNGMRIRVPNIRLSNEMIKAMGATPVPLPLASVHSALMQGSVDGVENPIPVLYGGRSHEGAKFLLMTNHQLTLASWVAGVGFIRKLPTQIVRMLRETGEEAGKLLDKENEGATKNALMHMKAAGVTVIEVDRAAFKASLKNFPGQFFGGEVSPETLNKVYSIIGRK